ncbi:hypothetical protein OS21_45440 [Dickeya oryzae]
MGLLLFRLGIILKMEKKIYNMFGIKVFPKNPDPGINLAYDENWFSVDAAIDGGAKWISSHYINRNTGQNTLYNMRWNPKKTCNSSIRNRNKLGNRPIYQDEKNDGYISQCKTKI